jgi:hypothetical protein
MKEDTLSLVEDSLNNMPHPDRFRLVHEVIQLAKFAPDNSPHKPPIWALTQIAQGKHAITEEPQIIEES